METPSAGKQWGARDALGFGVLRGSQAWLLERSGYFGAVEGFRTHRNVAAVASRVVPCVVEEPNEGSLESK